MSLYTFTCIFSLLNYMCTNICVCVCTRAHACACRCLVRPEEGIRFFESGVTGCELLGVEDSDLLQEKQALLNAEPSPKPNFLWFCFPGFIIPICRFTLQI